MLNEMVSIITPMYNSELYIKDTVKSVLDQTYSNWEWIIVDDCSTDNSLDIIKSVLNNENRIKLINLNTNHGPAYARNIAIMAATGRYIAFLDSDDLWAKDKLRKQVEFMIHHNAAISCTSYGFIDSKGKSILKNFSVLNNITYKDLLKRNYLSCDTVMIDRNVFSTVQIESAPRHEDYIYWLKIIKEVGKVYGIDEILAYYRINGNSRSSNKLKGIVGIWKVYRRYERLNVIRALYFTFRYITNGVFKYYFKRI